MTQSTRSQHEFMTPAKYVPFNIFGVCLASAYGLEISWDCMSATYTVRGRRFYVVIPITVPTWTVWFWFESVSALMPIRLPLAWILCPCLGGIIFNICHTTKREHVSSITSTCPAWILRCFPCPFARLSAVNSGRHGNYVPTGSWYFPEPQQIRGVAA